MSPRELLASALGLWLLAAIVYQAASLHALARLLARRIRKPEGPLPTCTLLRPLHGAGPMTGANLESLCDLGAPVVVGVEDEKDEAAAIARRVAARHESGRLTVRVGPAPPGANRKIANLLRLLPEARGEIVILTDGDVGVPAGYLDAILAPFADPRVGAVTCPYRSVGGSTLLERIDVILTNTGFLPSVAMAERLEGVRFALGATLAVRRSLLEAIGGLAPLLDRLADDHALAGRVLRAGYKVTLQPVLLDHHLDGASFTSIWRRQLRWARTVRALRPGGYAGTIVTHGIAPALAIALLGAGPAPLAAPVLWLLVRAAGLARLGRRLGLSSWDLALLPAADLMAFVLFVAGFLGRTVEWGGARYRVDRTGAITPHVRAALRDRAFRRAITPSRLASASSPAARGGRRKAS